MREIGFSTGAIARGDFMHALDVLAASKLPCLELSALRVAEVQPLVQAIPHLDLKAYRYVSFHAPSKFSAAEEEWLVAIFDTAIPADWPIVLHPDAIHDFGKWKRFGSRIAVENMDRRKPCGRSANELASVFESLPDARLCFDIGHARQFDSSMTEAFLILSQFKQRLVQLHVSEVNSESQHETISYGAKLAFQQIAPLLPDAIPVILESRVGPSEIEDEIRKAEAALTRLPVDELCYA